MNLEALDKVANDYTLDSGNLVFRDGRRRRGDPSPQEFNAYVAYVQRTSDTAHKPADIAAELVKIIKSRLDAQTTIQELDDEQFVQAILEDEEVSVRSNQYRIGGKLVEIADLENLIKLRTLRHNRAIPVVNGKKVAQPFPVEMILASYQHHLFQQRLSDQDQLQERLAHNPQLDADELLTAFLKMVAVEPTTLNKAVLYHWILNVKKAAFGFPMAFEMQINFLGPQTCGKTTVTNLLTRGYDHHQKHYQGPLEPFATEMQFDKIADPQFFVWGSRYLALVISEPAGERDVHLSPKELETWKAALTAQEFSPRAFYVQRAQQTPKLFSFISSSNKPISKIICDPSGARRLYEFEMKIPRGQQIVGAFEFPYLNMWKSVDEQAPHALVPGTPLHAELDAVQQTYMPFNTMDLFFAESSYRIPALGDKTFTIGLMDLYKAYKQFCEQLGLWIKSFPNFKTDIEAYKLQRKGAEYLLRAA